MRGTMKKRRTKDDGRKTKTAQQRELKRKLANTVHELADRLESGATSLQMIAIGRELTTMAYAIGCFGAVAVGFEGREKKE